MAIFEFDENIIGSFSVSAENKTGEKGNCCKLPGINSKCSIGLGMKESPAIFLKPESKTVIFDIKDMSIIKFMWFTLDEKYWRHVIVRMYWENEKNPSVEVPIGDFFGNGWTKYSKINSAMFSAFPKGGFTSYWEMPFKKRGIIEIENLTSEEILFFYQIKFDRAKKLGNILYFCSKFNRNNPTKAKEETEIINIKSAYGKYVGTYFAWQVNNNLWWGEGEVKFFIDGDKYPTICETGIEDYILGAWNWEHPKGSYREYTGLYAGLNQIIRPDGLYVANQRFGMYRLHIKDSIIFKNDLKIAFQSIGWRNEFKRYLPLKDDVATTAFWYQSEPIGFIERKLDADELEVI